MARSGRLEADQAAASMLEECCPDRLPDGHAGCSVGHHARSFIQVHQYQRVRNQCPKIIGRRPSNGRHRVYDAAPRGLAPGQMLVPASGAGESTKGLRSTAGQAGLVTQWRTSAGGFTRHQ